MKPVGWIYLIWQYKLSFFRKFREILDLVYCVITKRGRILVAYTKNHTRMNSIAKNAPRGILFVKLTFPFKKNYLMNLLASQIDIIYEDGPTTFSLTIDQPIIKEYEHFHFSQHKLADKQIKKIFVMSKWAKPNFNDPERKIEVLYPAVPLKKILSKNAKTAKIETKQLNILLMGSSAACKGVDILYYAFEKVEKTFENQYQLNLIIGSNYKRNNSFYPVNDECLDRTHQVYKNSLKKKNVYFDRIYPPMLVDYCYKNADIYVMPTRYDSFGISILEAMSAGLPIIATNITAIPEMVKHGENGFLLDVKDFDVQSREYFEYAVEELEKYLTILIEDASLRSEMGNESLQRVKRKFNLDYKKELLKKLFEEIIQNSYQDPQKHFK
jgi:glycosyltransferase involved in cell wall biosynthesis